MAKERNALRAGLFMVVSLALVILVVIAISGAGRFTQSFTTYSVAFSLQDDIGGLRAGDDVRIGGLKVGSVRDIQIRAIPADVVLDDAVPPGQPAIVVYIDLPSRYTISSDAHVAVEKSITGSAAINIDDLGMGTQMARTDYLHGRPDALSALFHRLGAIEPDIHAIMTNIRAASVKLNTDLDKLGQTADAFTETGFTANTTVHDLHTRLPEIVARYDTVTDSAVKMLDVVHDLLGPSSADFHATMANIHGLTGDLRGRLPELLNQLRGILQKTDASVSRAAVALQDVQATTASLRSVISGNKSKLDGMIASLKATSDNLKYASSEIRHSPWRLLYQPKPGEVANLNTYDSVRQFAEGASTLDDAAAALRDAAKDPNADPEQVKKLMANLDESFSRFEAVQEKLWKDIRQ